MNQPDILHVDIDAFFAAVEVMLNPALKGKPVIVGGKPDERGVVCTASYEARKYGIHSGMALRTAGIRCPNGIFLRGRYRVYSDFSNFSKRLSLDFPTFSFPQMWQKSLLLLESLLNKKRRPLRLVGVKVEEISRHRGLLPFVSLKGEQISSGVEEIKKRYGFSSIYTGRELLLEQLYPVERQGMVLRTASLTK